MNKAGLLGIIAAIGITTFAILDAAKNPKIFADVHGILIVIGGTFTVALLSFNFRKLFGAMKVLFRKMLGKERENYQETIKLIVELSEVYRSNPKGLAAAVPDGAHPFIKDAVQLISGYGFNVDEVNDILTNSLRGKRKETKKKTRYG